MPPLLALISSALLALGGVTAAVTAVAAGVLKTVIAGLVPGVLAGTLVVSTVSPDWLRLCTFVALLPLILLQSAGLRRPIRAERAAGLGFGAGVGVLYSVTTISGPPLALALSNQGLATREFRAALALVRLAESSMTAAAYLSVGLFTATSLALMPWIVPSVVIGVPVGSYLIRQMRPQTFRRICMSFDAWIVAFGLSGGAILVGCHRRNEGPALPAMHPFNLALGIAYLGHWFVVIPYTSLRMALLPKRLVWAKTQHAGQDHASPELVAEDPDLSTQVL